MAKMFYARVSTNEQNLDRQIEAARELGIDERFIFAEKVSGAREDRPELARMLEQLRPGDCVCVLSFDRLARSTKQLLEIAEKLEAMDVDLVSIHDNIDTTSPQGKFTFVVLAAVAELERSLIKQRQAEGIALAKKRGAITGRPRVSEEKLDAAIALWLANSHSIKEIEAITGISKSKLYNEIKARQLTR